MELKQQLKLQLAAAPLPFNKLRCDIHTHTETPANTKPHNVFCREPNARRLKVRFFFFFFALLLHTRADRVSVLNGMRAAVQIYMTSELCRDFGV